MDIKKVLTLIESAEKQTQTLTEGKNMAKDMVMQHYTKQEIKTPVRRPVNRLNEYFKVVDNEMLNVVKEAHDAKKLEVKRIVNRVLERLDEGKKAEAPKPRNFVAKNQQTSGAGAHKDKKKAEKQGDVKHKKDRVPMDVSEGLGDTEFKVGRWTYRAEEEDYDDVRKIHHSAVKPNGEEVSIDFSPYSVMTKDTFKMWVKLGMPTRKDIDSKGPLDNDTITDMFKEKQSPAKDAFKSMFGGDADDLTGNLKIRETNQLSEKAPPGEKAERMVKHIKKGYAKDGKLTDKEKSIAYATAWKHHNKKTDEGVAGPQKCWPGHRKVGTKPGTGKNAGKRVNDCEKIKETIEVGSSVKVYSNILKKPVYGHVVELKENKAYVNYANTKIVMAHPVTKVELVEATAAAPAAAGIGSKLARFIPGVGLVAGGYDAYQRAKQGDYTGAAISAGAGLSSLVPGIGTAAATGLIGAQLGRDKARTGSFLPSYDEIGAAGKSATPSAPDQSATPASSSYSIKKGDTLTKIAKANNTTVDAIMKANPQITDPNKIQAGAKVNLPSQSATPAPGANVSKPAPQPAAPKTQPATAAPGATVPNPQPDVSAGGASVTNRKLDVQAPVTTKQGNVTTTTSGSSSSATLKGITQDMVMNHPVYKAEMAKAAGKDPIQVRMAQKAAELKAKDAIGRDPSYLKNYKAPPPTPTGNKNIDDFME